MKDKERLIPTIRSDERSEHETGPDAAWRIAAALNSALAWYADYVAHNGARLLPREFEITVVPGPEDLQ